jgi:hypothetical protein
MKHEGKTGKEEESGKMKKPPLFVKEKKKRCGCP